MYGVSLCKIKKYMISKISEREPEQQNNSGKGNSTVLANWYRSIKSASVTSEDNEEQHSEIVSAMIKELYLHTGKG